MGKKTKKTQLEILQDIAEEYRQETHTSSINLKEVAAWMMREKGWQPKPRDAINLLAEELRVALREQYIIDPQGRHVRQKHPEKTTREMADGSHEQYVLWHDIREATRPQMQAAFQQRRFGVALDCNRLKIDVDSYNENFNSSDVDIQLELDFTDDVADMEHDEGE